MTPFPTAARRLPLLGCGLLAALALTFSGCGEEETAAKQGATAQQAPAKGKQQESGTKQAGAGESASANSASTSGCPRPLSAFVRELHSLRRQLAVGLSYDQYEAAVADLRASYAAIPVERLALSCLSATGTPAEDALNKYIDGANAWGECLAEAACTTATIEPVLQRKWRVASRHLGEAG